MSKSNLLEEIGIDLKRRLTGQIKTVCPKCGPGRTNKKDPCLSVDIDEGLYNCHHCDFRGRVFEKVNKEFIKPVARLEKLSTKPLKWFETERKISNNTLLRMKVTEAKEFMPQLNQETEVICFNYYRKDQLVNIKFRGPKKSFKMAKDAELIFYNLDSLVGEDSCVIVEGEIDCLTFIECGYYPVVSVPNGASRGSQKLEYLDNCWESFENMNKIILVTDDDEAGRNLRDELARRIGKEKCWTVEFPKDCKDPNEVFIRHGKEFLLGMIEDAKEWPLEGVMTMDDIYPTVEDWYINGYPGGVPCHIPGFEKLLSLAPGHLTMVTGIPNHGKDEFLNWVLASIAQHEKIPIGMCEFEETSPETVTKLAEKIAGKSFAPRKNKEDRMSAREFENAIGIIDLYFRFINTDDVTPDIDSILDVSTMLVKRFGMKILRINPWNWIELNRPPHLSETEYISLVLSKIIRFAKKWGVHVFLIAHTTKMQKDKETKKHNIPTLYDISGSAHFFNKAHNGFTVYRDMETNTVDVYVQKVKQSWLGKIGFSTYNYNSYTRQYSFVSCSVKEESSWRSTNMIDFTEPKERESA